MPRYFAQPRTPARSAMALITATLLLGGCTATGPSLETPRAPTVPVAPSPAYTAQGNEPGWQLAISDKDLTYQGDYGETNIRENHRGATQQGPVTRYSSPRLRVTVESIGCADTMADRRYRDKVVVVADGKSVTGCGGPILPPAQLNGTSWELIRINGANLLADVPTNLSFADGRISGTAGCNRFMGSFHQADALVRLSNIALTRKACAQPLMQQERDVVDALGKVTRHMFTPDGQMHLHGPSDEVMILRQIF